MLSGPINLMWMPRRGGARRKGDVEGGPPASDGEALEAVLRMAEAVPEGVLVVDGEGRIRAANAAACDILGSACAPDACDLLGQTLLEATHLMAVVDLNDRLRSGGDTGDEIDVRTVGPRERVLRVRGVLLPGGGDTLLVLEDRTEVERLRTVRTEFVANVSHELRTPLASIRATAETLLDGAAGDPDVAPRFLETILREADRLVRLSEDLLELAQAESTERERTPFDLSALVADVAARLAAQAERGGVSVRVAPAPHVVLAADEHEISQVLFNLLDNAIKYTPSGGTVTVEIRPDAERVAVSVADTGIGILSEDLPRIFERFWRADRARRFRSGEGTGGTRGTGLGLSIVKHIVEAHGGTVQAESELNRGSRFTITLPLETGMRDEG